MVLSRDEITARSKRLYPDAPVNPYTGTLNDPFQEAQSRYAGPGWEQFFGGLQKAQEDAQLAGKSFKVNWSGFGSDANTNVGARGGGPVARGRAPGYDGTLNPLELNPLEAQDAVYGARNQAASDEVDRQKAIGLAQNEVAKQIQQGDINDLQTAYQNQVLDSSLAPPEVPSQVTTIHGQSGSPDTFAVRSAPLTPQERLLSAIPGHLRLGVEQTLQGMDLKRKEADLAERQVALKERAEKAAEASNPMLIQQPRDASGTPITGGALLQRLAPPIRAQVQSLLDGRSMAPQGTAMKDPYWRSVITLANQVDPTFDTGDFNARFKTRQDFTSGQSSNQIKAIGQVLGHLSDYSDRVDALAKGTFGAGDYQWLNRVKNALTPSGTERGKTLSDMETLRQGIGHELEKIWSPTGAAGEKEVEAWKDVLNNAKSPEALHSALNTIAGMLETSGRELQNKYDRGMGTKAEPVVTPQMASVFDKLEGRSKVEMVAPDGGPLLVAPGDVDKYTKLGAKRKGK